jgi:hypothetical protein
MTRHGIVFLVFAIFLATEVQAQTQYETVRANIQCRGLNNSSSVLFNLDRVAIRLMAPISKSTPVRLSDASGVIEIPYRSYDLAPQLEIVYKAKITTPLPGGSATSDFEILDDGYSARRESIPLKAGTVIGNVLELGTVELSSVDCDLWYRGTLVIDDYHRQLQQTIPGNSLRMLRRAGVITGVPWTSYDVIEIPTDFMSHNEYANVNGRTCTLFHEFGHVIRHRLDGAKAHWTNDVFAYAYGRNHDGSEVVNVQYAFNEGWADYWEMRARPTQCPTRTTDTSGRDWNEWKVGNRLIELGRRVGGTKNFKAAAAFAPDPAASMVNVLRNNREKIHSLHQFEQAFVRAYPAALPSAPAVAACPPDYHDDGATCRRDATVAKPSYGRGGGTPLSACPPGQERSGLLCYPVCPAGLSGNGPFCRSVCPAGYTDDGLTCRNGLKIVSKMSQGRGAGSPMICAAGKEQSAALCYDSCKAGYSGNGPVCWGSCPSGTRDDGAVCWSVSVIIKGN